MPNSKKEIDLPCASVSTGATTEMLKRVSVVAADETAHLLPARLQKMGYAVSTVIASGEEALVQLRQERPTVVLVGLHLHGKMDGVTAAQALRHEFDLPVVHLAFSGDVPALERAHLTQPFSYVSQPFVDMELRAAIEIAFYRHQAEQQMKRANAIVRQGNERLEELVKQRTRQLEAVNRELVAFAYSVSHDLRAPIRIISGFAHALTDHYATVLDEEGQRFLNTLCQNAQRMDKMVHDFLRLSQLGHSPLQRERTDLTTLVKEVVTSLVCHPKQKPPSIEISDLPAAECDRALIRQVWENLLTNAVKYTRPQAAPQIKVFGDIKGQEAVYAVADNGVGFDLKRASKLFGVFQRFHPASEFEGTGVGLSIVQRIVLRHGGRVWAEASAGKGATFYFSLPLGEK